MRGTRTREASEWYNEPRGIDMRSHPGRCVQALERIQEVLRAEFDDLTPPDCVFVLSQLLWSFHEATDKSLKGAKEELR